VRGNSNLFSPPCFADQADDTCSDTRARAVGGRLSNRPHDIPAENGARFFVSEVADLAAVE
jgi:hypothetical protein